MYLVDTNVWLERLLDQAKSDEVIQFLDKTPPDKLFITDFAFHSIGVILTRLKRTAALIDFVDDLFIKADVGLVTIRPARIQDLVNAANNYNLDFDDAYQYVAAEQNELIIVSFDADLDKTPRGRETPSEILATL